MAAAARKKHAHDHHHGGRHRRKSSKDDGSGRVAFEDLFQPAKLDGTEFGMPGIVRGQYGGGKCVDEALIAEQKGVLADLIRSLGRNLLEGRPITNISLPVRIFEPRSFLQRILDPWCYAPLYLTKAARCQDDPVERLKWVLTFFISGQHRGQALKKPFNPILGETFEASYVDGTEVCVEQVSHHPPVTAFQLFGPDNLWRFHGYCEFIASFRPNGMYCGQEGPYCVAFADGTKITFCQPHVKLSGSIVGDRLYNLTDTIPFVDEKNSLRCNLTFNPDEITGIRGWVQYAKTPSDVVRGTIMRGDRKVCEVSGSWLEDLRFDDKVYWRIREYEPLRPIPAPLERALPSDCRRREDLIALAAGNEELAQKEKERLEDLQRRDRRLRDAGKKARLASADVARRNGDEEEADDSDASGDT